MIKITIDWKGKERFENFIRYIHDNLYYAEAQENIRILGHRTADKMREVIETERKNPARPDHKLENSITAETLSTTGGVEVGIGEIAKMNQEAPYWEMIDAGASYSTKNTHIVPTTYFADPGKGFITFKAGSTHIIEGIEFVGKAIRNLDKELREMMEKWGEKFLSGMGDASK